METLTDKPGGSFTVVCGDSFFTASLTLILPEALARFVDEADQGRGVLVAVPFRHQFAFRVIDAKDATLALNNMFRLAMLGYGDAPGPLSPHVYWVHDGEWTQATRIDDEGQPIVEVSAELGDALTFEG